MAETLPIRRKKPSNKSKNKIVKRKRMLKGKSYEFFLMEEKFELCEVDSFR